MNKLRSAIVSGDYDEITSSLENCIIDHVDLNQKYPDGHTVLSILFLPTTRPQSAFLRKRFIHLLFNKLAKLNVDVNLPDRNGDHIIFNAFDLDCVDIMKELVNIHNVDINIRNSNNDTLLRKAIRRRKIKMIKILVELGADIDIEDCTLASITRNSAIIDYLNDQYTPGCKGVYE